ncbi:hypothetical protein A0H76_2880 [Hepatospora eriocheir]|uniref:Uncharacterized protein n=1 Tax=Hepatospora eriocheir TaxID=1081669 RepID=A0A1X0Q5B2_9MICR|nr:hypothetical protein A0H76_2880 [Hepatospora eriocheir]
MKEVYEQDRERIEVLNDKTLKTRTDSISSKKQQGGFKLLIDIFKGTVISLFLMITDVLSVRTAFFDLNLSENEKLLYKGCQDKLNELSYIIFNISMMLSTLIYTNFGSLKTFMIGSAVFESRSITSDIARTVFDYFIEQGVPK